MKSKGKWQKTYGLNSALAVPFFSGISSFVLASILAFLIFVISLVKPTFSDKITGVITDTISPAVMVVTQPIHNAMNAFNDISGFSAMKAENIQLRAENVRLREWYQTALMLQAENKSLQELLNLQVPAQHNFVTARIITDTAQYYAQTLLIKAGAQNNIQKNQAVLAGDGMIGRVLHASDRTARVLLLTDINSRLPILVEGSNQKAILAGNNSDIPVLTHLRLDSGITVGDRVITSGDGGVFTAGHPVGRIVKLNDGNGYGVKLFADLHRLTHVRILNKDQNQVSPKNLIHSLPDIIPAAGE